MMTAAAVCAQVRKSFGLDHETITALAEAEAAGSEGVNFLPFLTGERTPNWPHSYGVLTGLRQGGMRPGLLYRAALEGATFSLLNGVLCSMGLGCSQAVVCIPVLPAPWHRRSLSSIAVVLLLRRHGACAVLPMYHALLPQILAVISVARACYQAVKGTAAGLDGTTCLCPGSAVLGLTVQRL